MTEKRAMVAGDAYGLRATLRKFSEDQPRDDAGRWSASGASDSPQGDGRFGQSDGNAKIDENNRSHWSSAASGHFAQGYTASAREAYGRAGPKDQRFAEQFRKDFTQTNSRHGFAGSGSAEYRHNETGKQYLVERMATGKNFWDTAHSITELPAGYGVGGSRDDRGRWHP